MVILDILLYLPSLLIIWDFFYFLIKGRHHFSEKILNRLAVMPLLYVMTGMVLEVLFDDQNDCCTNSALFSPEHRLSILILFSLCVTAYFYSILKKSSAPPVIEVALNCLLLLGAVLDILVAIQAGAWVMWVLISAPVLIMALFALARNHRLLAETLEKDDLREWKGLQGFCRKILRLKLLYKIPVLFILCLPLLTVLAGILLLFGQKQDSFIRAFTDTYYHGFSQWNHRCDGVVCPGSGHFLCTIAAQGHSAVVRPIRSGVRAGRNITCNRQLLISNAFEELLEQKWPALHRPIRRLYNRIGGQIHRHYGLFDHKWVSDLVYLIMKPLEWIFLFVLYCADRKPEDRIAQQYMSAADRKEIRRGMK